MKITVKEIRFKLIEDKPRSAWGRGIREYALDLLSGLEDTDYIQGGEFHTKYKVYPSLKETLLNGASSWEEYSNGGNTLINDLDIAERLCTPSELKRKKGGELDPNKWDTWLDVQVRALIQAYWMIKSVCERGGVLV